MRKNNFNIAIQTLFYVLLMLLLVISITTVEGYTKPEKYNTILIYDSIGIDRECRDNIDSIPVRYFYGVKALRFLPENKVYSGFYHYGQIIDIYGNCNKAVLMHELAHHCQKLKGDNLYQIANHEGNFNACMDKIGRFVESFLYSNNTCYQV